MAVPAPELPELRAEYLDMSPEFIVDREILPRFIEVCRKLANKFYNPVYI